MRLAKILKTGTTTGRKSFWDSVADLVIASQKVEGKNVSVDVREGYGSVINVNPQREGGTGACCIDGECSIITAAECSDAGGNFLGVGTTCDDVDCTVGACCVDGECSLTTEEECAGEFQGYGTDCDPNPCFVPGGCPDPGCPPITVSASVTFSVDDTESAGCDFHASKTETLFSGEVIDDICSTGAGYGPFEFNYPEYDNGQIFINSISVSLIDTQVCIGTDGVCGVFFDCDEFGTCCGSGYFCFSIDDAYMISGTSCADGCGTSTTFVWVNDDGMGFSISASLTITIT